MSRFLVVLLLLGGSAHSAQCQNVSIQPRGQPQSREPQASIRASVTLVLIPVSVTDRNGRTVNELQAASFSVFEDGVRRPIVSFSNEDAPCSVGIVLDLSGSMKSRISTAKEAVRSFFDNSNPQDEGFLMTFADKATLQIGFTRDFAAIQNSLVFERASGSTALIDAVYAALGQIRSAHTGRKALLVVSDGGENHSRHSSRELINAALESDVQIYSLVTPEHPRSLVERSEEMRGLSVLADLSEMTGGRQFVLRNQSELPSVMAKLGTMLRNQYVLGIRPSENASEGKWRKLKVEVHVPDRQERLRVDARTRYYAPEK